MLTARVKICPSISFGLSPPQPQWAQVHSTVKGTVAKIGWETCTAFHSGAVLFKRELSAGYHYHVIGPPYYMESTTAYSVELGSTQCEIFLNGLI